jgi:hypothetical protein
MATATVDLEMEEKAAIGDLKASSCYGNYLEGQKACSGCQIARYCMKTTVRVKSGSPPPAPGEKDPVPLVPPPDPKEYLLKTLGGKFTMEASRDGNVQVWRFYDGEGKPAFRVKEASGKFQLQSQKGTVVVEGFGSVADVEKELKGLL